jgi:hypothetical protein
LSRPEIACGLDGDRHQKRVVFRVTLLLLDASLLTFAKSFRLYVSIFALALGNQHLKKVFGLSLSSSLIRRIFKEEHKRQEILVDHSVDS